MGKKRNQKRAASVSGSKIQGYQGNRDPIVSIVQVGLRTDKTNAKKQIREFVAIERFRRSDETFVYIKTPFDPRLAKDPIALDKWLDDKRRDLGEYTTAALWEQGTVYSASKKKTETQKIRHLHEYSSEIGGDIHKKSSGRLKQIIKRASDADHDFWKELQQNEG